MHTMRESRFHSTPTEFMSVRKSAQSKQLDELCERDLTDNFRLTGWSYIANKEDFRLLRPRIQDIPEVAIVVQGGITSLNLTVFMIKRYAALYPSSPIIISTWTDTNEREISALKELQRVYRNLHILLNEKPAFGGYGEMNTNLQIWSSLQGLKYAKAIGVSFALKQRTDIVMGSLEFLNTLLLFHQYFSSGKYVSQEGKIVVGSMNSYRCRPFSVSDHFSFGRINDMIMMWDLEMPTSNETRRAISIKQRTGHEQDPIFEGDVQHLHWSAKPVMMDEAYLVSNLMKAANIAYSYDWNDSKRFIARAFIVIDTSSLEIYWQKYGCALAASKFRNEAIPNFADSRFGQSEISFTEWLSWHLEFCRDLPE